MYWLIATLLILGSGGLYILSKKESSDKKLSPEPEPVKKHTGSETVRELQQLLNSLLPVTYPKLVEDGIWGPKTAAAFDYVMNSKSVDTATKQKLKSLYYLIHGKSYSGKSTNDQVYVDLSQLRGKLSYPKRWYLEQANDLYDAMNRRGTSRGTIVKVFYYLKTKDDYKALYKAYSWRECTSGCMGFVGGDLVDWLIADLADNPNIYKKIQKKMSELGFSYDPKTWKV